MSEEKLKSPKEVKAAKPSLLMKVKTSTLHTGVYLREEPSTDSKALEVLESGTEVEVFDTVNGWHTVKGGYVMEEFLI